MAEQLGNSFLLKRYNGATYDTVGAMRSKSLKMNGETVDITHDGSGGVRTLLDGGGVKSMSLSGNGVFDTAENQTDVMADFLAGLLVSWQIVVPGWGTYDADFQITSLEVGGEANNEVTFSMALESSGTITFTAE